MTKKRRKQRRKRKPLWRLEDGVTYSLLSKYIECPEQFSLAYIEGLTPTKLNEALEYGSMMHLCLEHQYEKTGNPSEVAQDVLAAYVKFRSAKLKSTRERDELKKLAALVGVIFPVYCKHWQKDDERLRWISREEKFDQLYSLPTPQGTRKIRMRGMRDGVFEVGSSIGIFETKTKQYIDEEKIINGLRADMQTMFYVLATYLQRGVCPQTVLYNVIRRPSIRQKKKELLGDYLKRVKDDVESRFDWYFYRWEIVLLPSDLDNFINQTLNPLLLDFVRWWDGVKKNPLDRFQYPYHRLVSPNLIGKFGKTDMYDAVHGNMKPYTTRSAVFPELEESILVG